jgi:hypothetical protein
MTTGDAEPPVPYNITLAPKGKIMNDGVKILLERMKTHPEEFFDESSRLHVTSKWGTLIADHQNFLELEDKKALDEGLKKLHQQIFTEKVMEELVDPKSDNWAADSAMRAKINYPNKIPTMPLIKSVPFSMTEHIEAHEKFIGQTPIAGVTQTL